VSFRQLVALPGENDSSWLGPGFLGFLSLVFLAVAVFVIWKSLNKQLKRVTFDEDAVNAGGGVGAVVGVGPASPAAGVPAGPSPQAPGAAPHSSPSDPPLPG